MLTQSSIFLLAVIQVIIPGSQTTDHDTCGVSIATTPSECQHPATRQLCRKTCCELLVTTEKQCHDPTIKQLCPETCNRLFKDCSLPWHRVGEQCFQVVYQDHDSTLIYESWNVARVWCNVQEPGPGYTNVRLAVPDSIQTLHDFLTDQTQQYPHSLYWIGASNLYKGEWYWNNGTEYNNTSPKSIHDPECLYMNTLIQDGASNTPNIVWPIHNVGINGCWGSLHFVCEKY